MNLHVSRPSFVITFTLAIGLLAGCTAKNESARVTVVLPGVKETATVPTKSEMKSWSTASQAPVQALSTPPTWGRPRPTTLAEARCFAVVVETPEDAASKTAKRCKADSGNTLQFAVSSFAGLAEAGSTIDINVASGSARKFHVLAFAAESAADCIATTAGTLIPTGRLSAPALIASKVVDVVPGDNIVNVTASFTGATPIENCEWTSPPGLNGGSIAINSGATITRNNVITISNSISFVATEAYYTTNPSCSAGGAWESYDVSRSGFVLSPGDGVKTVYAKFRDSAGAVSSCLSSSITLDQTLPTLTLNVVMPINQLGQNNYALSGTCSEPGRSVSWQIGNISGTALCSGTTFSATALNLSALGDGTHNVTVGLSDLAGNSTSIHNSVIKDTVPPSIAFTLPAAAQLYSATDITNVIINGTCSEEGLAVSASSGAINTTTNCVTGTFSATLNLTSKADGLVPILITITDAAGNIGAANRNIIKDSVAPTASITGIPNTIVTEPSVTMTVTGTEVFAYKMISTTLAGSCNVDANYTAAAESPIGTPLVATLSGAGIHYVCVIGRDLAGNFQPASLAAVAPITVGPIAVSFANHISLGNENLLRTIPLTLSTPASIPITVEIQTQGTAAASVHYTGLNSDLISVTFNAGSTTANLPISTIGSSITNTEKVMSLAIRGSSTMSGVTLGTSEHQLWMQDANASALSVTKMAMGATHACSINSSGKLFCWGDNGSGQLGNGSYTSSDIPVPIDAGNTYTEVATGVSFTCAIRSDANLYCWGNNGFGQLGIGTTTTQVSPQLVGAGVLKVSAGNGFACQVNSANQLLCWGSQSSGQLGNGVTSGYVSAPTLIGSNAVDVSVGWDHGCALYSSNGTINCWGNNSSGQVGDGTTSMRSTPVTIATGMSQVSAGMSYSCSIRSDGKAFCWGLGSSGQLGNLSSNNSTVPVAAQSTYSFGLIRAGSGTTCAADTSSGYLKCWGYAYYGVMGDGTVRAQSYAPTAPLLPGVVSNFTLGLNSQTACAVVADKGYCWGAGRYGVLGNGFNSAQVVKEISPDPLFIKLSLGRGGCGITNTGKLMCWGPNELNSTTFTGAVGDGSSSERNAPVYIDPSSNYQEVAVGLSHSCAITTSGALKCWGLNTNGQLGLGNLTASTTPKTVNAGTTYSKVAVGSDSTCAISSSGALSCWGNNNYGQVGDGTTTSRVSPIPLLVGMTFQQISVGSGTACALATSNALYCWGNNTNGQLATGALAPLHSPSLISGTWSMVSVGAEVMCAIDTSGNLSCAGRNGNGELATGSISPGYYTSLQSVGSNFTSVQVGKNTKSNGPGAVVCGLQAGTAKCWGSAAFGQLAPSIASQTTPTNFDGGGSYNEIHVGELQQCGRTVTGQYRCRGSGEEAQMPFGVSILRPNLVPRVRY